MAISLVGTATGTNTATPPAHQAGDLFLVFAYRDGSTTRPDLPAGFTLINNRGANANAFRVGRKFAASSSDTVGTCTNATSVILVVLRGVNTATPTGGTSSSSGVSTTITHNSLTLADSSGSSWVIGFAGHTSNDVAIDTVPSGMTLTASVSDATDEAVAFRVEGATSFTSRTASVGGTSSGWLSCSVEIRAAAQISTEYPQTVGITSSAAVALSLGLAFGMIQAIASSGSVSRALGISKRSTVAGLAAVSRVAGVSRLIGLTSSGAVSSTKSAAKAFAVTSAASVAVAASRAYLIAASIASSGAVTASKTAGKVASIAGAGLVALRKAAARSVGISSAGSVAVQATRAFLLSLSVASVGAVSAVRSVGKGLAAVSSGAVSARRAISKASAITSAASVAARKAMDKTFALASAGEASIRKVAGKMASVLPTSSVATQKAVDAQRTISAASVVSLIKSLPVVVSVASAGVVSASKTVGTVIGFVSVALVASAKEYLNTRVIEPAAKRIAATVKRVRQAAAEVRPRLAVSKAVRRAVQTVRSARSSKARKKK